MEWIILCAGGVWFYTLYRGRLFVRAYMFLIGLEDGMDVDAANCFARSIGYLKATEYVPQAKFFANSLFNGRQLPVIALARAKGFWE